MSRVERDAVQRGHLLHGEADRADRVLADIDAAVLAPRPCASMPNVRKRAIAALLERA